MNLLLVDSTVKDYEVFVNAANSTTRPVVYFPHTTRQELLAALHGPIERIAVVSHTTTFIERESLFSDLNVELFRTMIETHQVKQIDYLACNTLHNPEWIEYFKKIPCVIGASNDLTGNLKYGGDWVMESTSENIEAIYFTSSIEYYNYLLVTPGIISLTYDFPAEFIFTLPVSGDYTDIDWGDNTAHGTSNDTEHPYLTSGSKTVVITGSNLALSHINVTNDSLNTACIYLTSCNDLSGVTNLKYAFYGCSNLVSVPLTIPSGIIDMIAVFHNASTFNGDISEWDTSQVQSMYNMFYGASAFDQNIGDWDFSSLSYADSMFNNSGLSTDTYNAMLTSLNDNQSLTTRLQSTPLTIGVSGLTYTNTTARDELIGKSLTFDGDSIAGVIGYVSLTYDFPAGFIFTLPVTGNYTDIDWGDGSDHGTSSDTEHPYDEEGSYTVVITGSNLALSQGDPTGTSNTACAYLTSCSDLSGATLLEYAFAGCSNLESVPLTIPTGITNMIGVFHNASTFNGDISEWDTSQVQSMYNMFYGASAFDQNIGDWDFSSLSFASGMFDNSGLSTDTYNAMLTSLNDNQSLTTRLQSTPLTIGVSGLTYTNTTARDALVGKGLSFDGDLGDIEIIYTTNGNTLTSVTPTDLDTYDLSSLDITSIGAYVFQNFSLRTILIPASVTSIGPYAFAGCASLTTVTIPTGTNLAISDYAFQNCENLDTVTVERATTIGKRVFQNCEKLDTIGLSTVTSIGESAFQNCKALDTVTFPSTAFSIGDYSFQNTALTTVTVPSLANPVGKFAFSCTSLNKVTIG